MVKHYDGLIFSNVVKEKDYSFSNVNFGKSNTDQSFYEPMSSMVQNAAKSGSFTSSIHNGAEQSISEIRANSVFLPNYMTLEETNSMVVCQQELAKKSIDDVNNHINLLRDEVNSKIEIEQKSLQDTD